MSDEKITGLYFIEKLQRIWITFTFCSGQVKLATVLESFQYKRSDSFGVNPPLY